MMKVILSLLMVASLAACDDSYKKAEQEREARINRAKELDALALKTPITIHTPAVFKYTPPPCNFAKGDTRIGMTRYEVVECGWGRPSYINRTTTAYGTEEQWVYNARSGYLYFDTTGVLRSMQH
jgi:hypothetical protein